MDVPNCPANPDTAAACALAAVCHAACQSDTANCHRPIRLGEALDRFTREATRAVCDTGRFRCPYYSWGQGPPLLIIPGLSDQAASFVMVAALLADQFRCIAFDLPTGKGDGARLRRYSHADLVADALAVLEHAGARQGYVLGSSFGSTIALAALRTHPQRLLRGVLVGGFAHRPLAPAEVLLARMARLWPGAMRHLPLRRMLLRRAHGGPFAHSDPDVWEYLLERWGAAPIAAVARRALLLHATDLRPALSEIRQPILLVCGDHDPLVGPACEAELMQGLPRAIRVELPECGHNPQFTHPGALAEVVRQFLTPPAGSG
jgi:pimeloyl-ACP methyl ester carboxylesterase